MPLEKISFQVMIKSKVYPLTVRNNVFFPILLYFDAKHVLLLQLP